MRAFITAVLGSEPYRTEDTLWWWTQDEKIQVCLSQSNGCTKLGVLRDGSEGIYNVKEDEIYCWEPVTKHTIMPTFTDAMIRAHRREVEKEC